MYCDPKFYGFLSERAFGLRLVEEIVKNCNGNTSKKD